MSTVNHMQFMGRAPIEEPYGGVQWGAEMIGDNIMSAARGQVESPRELAGMTVMTTLCVIDLPLSFIADTIWLPHDIRSTREKRNRSPAEPTPESVYRTEK
jgi:uncharacterized protein YceK